MLRQLKCQLFINGKFYHFFRFLWFYEFLQLFKVLNFWPFSNDFSLSRILWYVCPSGINRFLHKQTFWVVNWELTKFEKKLSWFLIKADPKMFKTVKSKFIFFSIFLILITTVIPVYFLIAQLHANFEARSIVMLDTTLDIVRYGHIKP